jgi:hypothetical protein
MTAMVDTNVNVHLTGKARIVNFPNVSDLFRWIPFTTCCPKPFKALGRRTTGHDGWLFLHINCCHYILELSRVPGSVIFKVGLLQNTSTATSHIETVVQSSQRH